MSEARFILIDVEVLLVRMLQDPGQKEKPENSPNYPFTEYLLYQ